MTQAKQALARAISIAGSQAELAQRIGRGQTTVSKWLRKGKVETAEDALAIERAVQSRVTRYDLRPDIWQRV